MLKKFLDSLDFMEDELVDLKDTFTGKNNKKDKVSYILIIVAVFIFIFCVIIFAPDAGLAITSLTIISSMIIVSSVLFRILNQKDESNGSFDEVTTNPLYYGSHPTSLDPTSIDSLTGSMSFPSISETFDEDGVNDGALYTELPNVNDKSTFNNDQINNGRIDATKKQIDIWGNIPDQSQDINDKINLGLNNDLLNYSNNQIMQFNNIDQYIDKENFYNHTNNTSINSNSSYENTMTNNHNNYVNQLKPFSEDMDKEFLTYGDFDIYGGPPKLKITERVIPNDEYQLNADDSIILQSVQRGHRPERQINGIINADKYYGQRWVGETLDERQKSVWWQNNEILDAELKNAGNRLSFLDEYSPIGVPSLGNSNTFNLNDIQDNSPLDLLIKR